MPFPRSFVAACTLTISLASLVASYRDGTAYCYMRAFRDAACELAGPELAAMLASLIWSS